ncbi:complement C1q subcomponent subunit C-like isoform X2 [Solea solea]|uniref:complement C1q subcomponent subunit C-like isoform X2 n=2 Tax=Solea solea TaxID=90069 RepID=UPI00272D7F32|nr:complement C1q subcomponent subunit C-like isoform X2 [Solea solea]
MNVPTGPGVGLQDIACRPFPGIFPCKLTPVVWTMRGYFGIAVGVALLLTTGQCDTSCGGIDGLHGVLGVAGRDGWPGEKGQKGEPGSVSSGLVDGSVLKLRGERGSRGLQGPMGPKGYHGDVGAAGHPGKPGRRGPSGDILNQGQSGRQAHVAFSVIRRDRSYPRPAGSGSQTITYQSTVVNKPGDIVAATGIFTCRVPGVYYFTFHSVAKVSMCLRIASQAVALGFCDYNRGKSDHVLSGGAVLQLTLGQRVWLESFRDQQTESDMRDTQDKQIIFNGFLLFPGAQ